MSHRINRKYSVWSALVVGLVVSSPFWLTAYRGHNKAQNLYASIEREKQGEELLDAGNTTAAAKKFQEILSSNTDRSTGYYTCSTHYFLGVIFFKQKNYEDAIKEERAAIRDYDFMLAQVAEALKNTPSANPKRRRDGFSSAYYELGMALNAEGKRNEAREAWKTVLALPDQNWYAVAQDQLDKNPEPRLKPASGNSGNFSFHAAASGRGGKRALTVTKSSGRARVETLCSASKITTSA